MMNPATRLLPLLSLPLGLASACGAPRVTGTDVLAFDAPSDAAIADVPRDVPASEDAGGGAPRRCARYARSDEGGALRSAAIDETSGLVEASARPGALFVHNDSGDTARFFAIDLRGALLAEYHLEGASAVDWEDLTRAPCGEARCLYLADIGDNARRRAEVTLLRVEEPVPPASAPASLTPTRLPWTSRSFRYPDGAHNAETLVADPASGALYVITKVEAGAVQVFRVPEVDGGVASRVAELTLPAGAGQLTGGDVRDDGSALLLRTYARVLRLDRAPGAPFEALFSAPPEALAVMVEPQGEAIGWRVGRDGYITISEGVGVRINVFACEDP